MNFLVDKIPKINLEYRENIIQFLIKIGAINYTIQIISNYIPLPLREGVGGGVKVLLGFTQPTTTYI